MLSTIDDFLKNEDPIKYDFKNQIKELDKEDNNIKKFLIYKHSDSSECDKSQLLFEIYHKIWGWPLKGEKSYRLVDINGSKVLLGSDTMNSFWKIYEVILKKFYRSYQNEFHNEKGKKTKAQGKKLYEWLSSDEQIKKVKDMIGSNNKIYKELNEFAKLTHSIGNFTLLPVGFNSIKGIRWDVQDYFDLFLNKWKTGEWMIDQSKLNSYIKTFLLDEYYKDDKIISLFTDTSESESKDIDGHSKIITKTVANEFTFNNYINPSSETEIYNYLYNVNRLIMNRGKIIVKKLSSFKER